MVFAYKLLLGTPVTADFILFMAYLHGPNILVVAKLLTLSIDVRRADKRILKEFLFELYIDKRN